MCVPKSISTTKVRTFWLVLRALKPVQTCFFEVIMSIIVLRKSKNVFLNHFKHLVKCVLDGEEKHLDDDCSPFILADVQ